MDSRKQVQSESPAAFAEDTSDTMLLQSRWHTEFFLNANSSHHQWEDSASVECGSSHSNTSCHGMRSFSASRVSIDVTNIRTGSFVTRLIFAVIQYRCCRHHPMSVSWLKQIELSEGQQQTHHPSYIPHPAISLSPMTTLSHFYANSMPWSLYPSTWSSVRYISLCRWRNKILPILFLVMRISWLFPEAKYQNAYRDDWNDLQILNYQSLECEVYIFRMWK